MDSRMVRARVFAKKPLLLKDFLLDDLGSCSSNGFKSFPRRQCCSSVPLLHEFDLKKNKQMKERLRFNKSAISAFRSVFAAVKRLPFAAGVNAPNKKKKESINYSFLPRRFSAAGFWKKRKNSPRKEIERWKSFDQLLKEDSVSANASIGSVSQRWPATVSRFAATETGECSNGIAASSDGTVTTADADKNDVAEVVAPNDDVLTESVTFSDGSVISSNSPTNPKQKEQWSSEEKEQFSPMSVLDCPFDDDDEVSSPFEQRLARMEGTKKKLMKKIHMFESLAKLEPLNLATRFATKPDSDIDESSIIDEKSISDIEEQHQDEVDILDEGMEGKTSSYNDVKQPSSDISLMDLFSERISSQWNASLFDEGQLEEAKDCIHGRGPEEKALEWEVEKNRQGYIKDMEKNGEWKKLDQEIKEVAFMLESEVFDALLDKLLEETFG